MPSCRASRRVSLSLENKIRFSHLLHPDTIKSLYLPKIVSLSPLFPPQSSPDPCTLDTTLLLDNGAVVAVPKSITSTSVIDDLIGVYDMSALIPAPPPPPVAPTPKGVNLAMTVPVNATLATAAHGDMMAVAVGPAETGSASRAPPGGFYIEIYMRNASGEHL